MRLHHARTALPARLAAALLPGVLARTDAPGGHLTFDDGPSEATTPRLLDLLAAAGQTATFFVLTDAARQHRALLRRIVDERHGVGAHGTAHTDFWRQPGRALAEMSAACAWLEDATGRAVRYVRPPYGHLTPTLYRWTRRTARSVALWDAMPGDFLPHATPAGVAQAARRWSRAGSIVVLHDGAALAHVTPEAVAHLLGGPLASTRLPE